MAQHDKSPLRERAEKFFEAGLMSPSEIARLLDGADRANVKRWRNAWLKERGLPMPELDHHGRSRLSREIRPSREERMPEKRVANSETQFVGLPGAARSANPAPNESVGRPDMLDDLLASLPIKLPLVVSDDAPLMDRQQAFALRAFIRRMSRRDAFAAAGVKSVQADEWMADLTPRASGLSFAEEVEMARAIGALEHVEALAKFAAQNPFSPKSLDVRQWLLERSHQDFIRKQAEAIVVGGEVFVRTTETTAPARLVQDIEAIAKRLVFNLPQLPASEEINEVIDVVVQEIEDEARDDDE